MNGDFVFQMPNGPVALSGEDDEDIHNLDAINELQFKLDKKNKEFEKVCQAFFDDNTMNSAVLHLYPETK